MNPPQVYMCFFKTMSDNISFEETTQKQVPSYDDDRKAK